MTTQTLESSYSDWLIDGQDARVYAAMEDGVGVVHIEPLYSDWYVRRHHLSDWGGYRRLLSGLDGPMEVVQARAEELMESLGGQRDGEWWVRGLPAAQIESDEEAR